MKNARVAFIRAFYVYSTAWCKIEFVNVNLTLELHLCDMFLTGLALVFLLFALIAAFKMESFLKGFLFILALCVVSGVFFLFIRYPGLSGLVVALMLGAFILRQTKN